MTRQFRERCFLRCSAMWLHYGYLISGRNCIRTIQAKNERSGCLKIERNKLILSYCSAGVLRYVLPIQYRLGHSISAFIMKPLQHITVRSFLARPLQYLHHVWISSLHGLQSVDTSPNCASRKTNESFFRDGTNLTILSLR